MVDSSRRIVVKGAIASGVAALAGSARAAPAAKWTASQLHNQPAASPLHQALEALWSNVREQTKGALDVTVHASNNGVAGSDPAVLKLLQSGEVQFYTLMGGILSQAVPVMDVQGLPYAFSSSAQVYRLDDGPLGRLLDAECRAKGIERMRGALFENGFRQTNTVDKPINAVDDFAGLKIRVPDGEMFRDFFTTLGAKPATLNINKLYDALKAKEVDGQENPLVIAETNKLFEVTKQMAMTNHMWSGFNLLSNRRFWNSLPVEVKRIVDRNAKMAALKQRRVTMGLNASLGETLRGQGMAFTTPDVAPFKAKLADGFYGRWKKQLGSKAWTLLEEGVGKIG